jgi:hypothetical protein
MHHPFPHLGPSIWAGWSRPSRNTRWRGGTKLGTLSVRFFGFCALLGADSPKTRPLRASHIRNAMLAFLLSHPGLALYFRCSYSKREVLAAGHLA